VPVSIRNIFVFILLFSEIILYGQNSKSHLKAAELFITNGYYTDAIGEYNIAISLDPQYGRAYEERASAFEHLKEWEKAAADYQHAAVFGSNPAENFFKAAEILDNLNKADEALDALNKSIAQNQKYYEAYILQSKLYYKSGRYNEALTAADNAVSLKNTAYAFYLKGLAEYKLNDLNSAESDFEKAIIKDKFFPEAYLSLANVQLQDGKIQNAIENCSYVIMNDRSKPEAYIIRSEAYNKIKELDKAISDISKAISIDSLNSNYYLKRGEYYIEYSQFQNAINDFTVANKLNNNDLKAITERAMAYEKINDSKRAIDDYTHILELSDESDLKTIEFLQKKIFELRRESNKPVITLIEPHLTANYEVPVPINLSQFVIQGKIKDESKIKLVCINNDTLVNNNTGIIDSFFSIKVNTSDIDYLTISVKDLYDNTSTLSYSIKKIETDPPRIVLQNPLEIENNKIAVESEDTYLYVEGQIEGKNLISSIHIDDVNASFTPADFNPKFTATMDVSKKNRIKITATDIYGNSDEKEYFFERKGKVMNDDSPMGKTWAVLIENSDYKDFDNLHTPLTDIKLIQEGLDRYKINSTIVKKNLTKRELERFFSIELRDLVRINHVNSLFIWYAGHGLNVRGIGYWIPCDAAKNDEFSYYNIFALKASLYSYASLTHLLIVSDACSTGPGFNVALRGTLEGASCNQTDLTIKKSSQVFTSAGEGYAYDNSLFTRSFANALLNNENKCITIDEIVNRVNTTVRANTSQSPEFGRIAGLEDQQGTFFFISK
jgi:tetratricopeptide (TPR) repeat protein